MSVGCARGDGASCPVFATRVPSGSMPHALSTGMSVRIIASAGVHGASTLTL